jgi:hypothetical protein
VKFREDWLPIVRDCLAGATDWYDVESCLRQHVADDEIEDGRPLVYAFAYMLTTARSEDRRNGSVVFAPQAEWANGGSFPEPLEGISDEMLGLWQQYADALADDPIAASRLGDLLWVRRHGERRAEHARSAVDSYLGLSSRWVEMGVVDTVARALEITVELSDVDRQQAAIQRAVEVIRTEYDVDEWRPGIALRLIEALVDLRPEARPPDLPELLAKAADRYGEDPFIAQAVSELQAELTRDPELRAQFVVDQIRRWRAEAGKTSGLTRYSHLQQALGIARAHGLTELVNDTLTEIQSMSEQDLDLKQVSSEIRISAAEREAETSRIAERAQSLDEALALFGVDGPPSGDATANEALVARLAEQHPLTVLIPRQVLGPYGGLVYEAQSPAEHRRADLAQQEALRIQFWAALAVEKLNKITDKFGVPSRDLLVELFTTELIDDALAQRFSDGLSRHFEGDEDGALHILIPQIEAAIRGIAARIGVPVIKNPEGGRPGGVVLLAGVISALEGRMDESWRRYLKNALVDPLGVNLRNQVAHGLHGPATPADVVIAAQIACHLRLLRPAMLGADPQRAST